MSLARKLAALLQLKPGATQPALVAPGAINEAAGVSIASAATVNIGAAESNNVTVTGTTTITAFDTIGSGAKRTVTFSGALTLTHNATSLILPGATSITTAAGDIAVFVSLGSGNWQCVNYAKADGKTVMLNGLNQGTAVATTSGTAADFTGIPSWVKRITVSMSGVSTNGANNLIVQLGTSGGLKTTGYLGGLSIGNNAIVTGAMSSGFDVSTLASTSVIHAQVILTNIGSNTWAMHGISQHSNQTTYGFSAGSVTLAGVLDRLRLTTVGSTNTFDAGSVNILYE